jgi:hypothetical protein
MAIISIPTSIGGVSIPGAAINGPLGALFGNKFGRTDLQYPRDLQSATRGHYIQFTINEIQPAKYDVTKLVGSALGSAQNALSGAAEAVLNPTESFNTIKNFFSDEKSMTKFVNLTQPKKNSVGTISLYIPETVNFTYAAQYDKLSLATALQQTPIIGGVAKTVLQKVNEGPARLLARSQGYAFNPQQQILFDGIDFRTYQMAFVFTPYSKQEAAVVEKIIKQFKFHAAPRLATGSAGMFFVPPSTFTPKFFFNGQENKKINKITESVIENIDVNYAPNGFTTQSDGAPTQIQLTINFKEIELLTRDRIQQGY